MNTITIIKKLNKKADSKHFCKFIRNRFIDLNTTDIDTLSLDEEQYDMYIKACDNVTFENDSYEIYFCYDSSGYEYWTTNQEENNYICCTIRLKKCKGIDVDELYSNIKTIIARLNLQLLEISSELHYDY